MKRKKEKNIDVFNQDVQKKGRYAYTVPKLYSASTANKRQSQEILKILKEQNKANLRILDVGCGDGTYTYEILKEIQPKKIVGFDSAKSAVNLANKKYAQKNKQIEFMYCDIYDANKVFKKKSFDIIVIRGVLHHVYDPQKAIRALSFVSDKIIVLEPNGYNPMLKLIEKVSPYHRKHEERSYWPPELNAWFGNTGFQVRKQVFCGIVPYFCPEFIARSLKFIEPFMEQIPFFKKFYCGTNVIYFEKE